MKQIIAFDGCDCIGKSSMINKLDEQLKKLGFNTFIFHLTGPGEEQNFINGFNNIGNISKTAIQYLKFYELFKNIETIISANTNNIVILDRTPYSEYIWAKFFKRDNADSAKLFNDKMFETFENINKNMVYISLNVDTDILVNRILINEEDRENFLTAFDNYYTQDNLVITEGSDIDECKVLFMVQWVKNNYDNLELELMKNCITVQIITNNNNTDMINGVKGIITAYLQKR